MEHKVHNAEGAAKVSVRHFVCWAGLLSVLFIRLMRLKVWVNQGSAFEPKTMFGLPRVAKAFADAGNSVTGMIAE